MKKILFILCLSSALGYTANAQNSFAPDGAEWWFSYNEDNNWIAKSATPSYYTTRTYVNGDTVIDGTPCRRLSTEYFRRKINDTATYYGTMHDWYFYDNTDTVFFYNPIFERFTPLYIFNAEEGDTICLPVVPVNSNIGTNIDNDLRIHPLTGDTSFCFRIDSVRTELFDGVPLRVFYTYAIGEYSPNSTKDGLAYPSFNWSEGLHSEESHSNFDPKINVGKYIEKIIGPFFPRRLFTSSASHPEIFLRYLPDGILNCYSDDSTNIHLSDSSCDYLSYEVVSVRDMDLGKSLVIYPNPAGSVLYINSKEFFDSDLQVNIFDITGRTVQTYIAAKGNRELACNVSGLVPGIYILQITDGINKYYKKVAVQR